MKNITKTSTNLIAGLSLFLLSFVFVSCDQQNDKSDAYGNFELDKTIVSAEATGQILWLKIEEGMLLQENQKVGQVDTMVYHYQKNQLKAQQQLVLANIPDIEAQIKVQEQQKKNILVQKNRLEKLFKKKAATQKQLDDINGNLDLLATQLVATNTKRNMIYKQIKAIDSQLATLDYQISNCSIISPINGSILNQFGRKGEIAVTGKAIFSMASLQDIRLKVYVSGSQLPHIKLKQKVSVFIDEDQKENQELEGEIVWIAEEAEFTPKTVQTKEERVNLVYAVKIKVKNNGELKAGMPGEMMINK